MSPLRNLSFDFAQDSFRGNDKYYFRNRNYLAIKHSKAISCQLEAAFGQSFVL